VLKILQRQVHLPILPAEAGTHTRVVCDSWLISFFLDYQQSTFHDPLLNAPGSTVTIFFRARCIFTLYLPHKLFHRQGPAF
jgi:hypothetical protein